MSLVSTVWACGGDVAAGPGTASSDAGEGDAGDAADATSPLDAGAKDSGPNCTVAPCVTNVGIGGAHACAVVADGTVRCWGANFYGGLGTGVVVDAGGGTTAFDPPFSAAPLRVTGENDIVEVVAGGRLVQAFGGGTDSGFTCALHRSGAVDCWGFGGPLLGTGDASSSSTSSPVHTSIANAVSLSAGLSAVCALLADGTATCWGSNAEGQVHPPASSDASGFAFPSPTAVVLPGVTLAKIAVGADSACAVATDGHLWCWGNPSAGQTGHPSDGSTQTSPEALPAEVPGLDSVTSVAVGEQSACALLSNGSVFCFGFNALGMLGREPDVDGGPPTDAVPRAVSAPSSVRFAQIVAHEYGFCALDTSSAVWCWGRNRFGETGSGAFDADAGIVTPEVVTVPTKVPGLVDVEKLATTGLARFQCALVRGGSVKCWGDDAYGSIGIAPADGSATVSAAPVTIAF